MVVLVSLWRRLRNHDRLGRSTALLDIAGQEIRRAIERESQYLDTIERMVGEKREMQRAITALSETIVAIDARPKIIIDDERLTPAFEPGTIVDVVIHAKYRGTTGKIKNVLYHADRHGVHFTYLVDLRRHGEVELEEPYLIPHSYFAPRSPDAPASGPDSPAPAAPASADPSASRDPGRPGSSPA
jgi:hypothetical protein